MKFCFYFTPTVTLLEGIIYLVLSIWGFVMRECSEVTTDISSKTFEFLTDLIYLQDEDCGNPNVTVFGVNEPVTLQLNWVNVEPIKLRTYIFLILYTIFSTLWIITSILALSSLSGKTVKLWMVMILSGSIIDCVVAGFSIYDIVHTSSASTTYEYLGLTTDKATLTYLNEFDAEFTAPAIVMTAISSRVVVLWLLNIIGSIYCVSSFTKTQKNPIIATTVAFPVTIVTQEEPRSKNAY